MYNLLWRGSRRHVFVLHMSAGSRGVPRHNMPGFRVTSYISLLTGVSHVFMFCILNLIMEIIALQFVAFP